jgi:carboxyl-terminal processing protease
MQDMKDAGVSELVLDLRYNGGGLLAVASQVSYMIAGETRSTGKTFEKRRFNALAGNRNPVTGQVNTPVPFFSKGLGFSLAEGANLPALNLSRVYVLTTASTCSASEAVINGLRGIDVEVVLIGDGTCGKPYGFYPQDNCGTTYFTVQFEGQNHKGFSEYTEGFIAQNSSQTYGVKLPGCEVSDEFTYELGDEREELLSTALSYMSTIGQ